MTKVSLPNGKARSRQVMVSLAVSWVLYSGIIAAAGGFVFWLANALAVAIVGALFLAIGALILVRTADIYRILGNASALIGAGMLCGGATIDLIDKLGDQDGGLALLVLGGVGAVIAAWVHRKRIEHAGVLTGSILTMTAAMHIFGLIVWVSAAGVTPTFAPLVHFYTFVIMFGVGLFINVRLITALAIVPFAQMLETGTFYDFAMYAFYSPETTLSILQMSVAMAVCVALSGHLADRSRRHTHMFGIMAFIVANMCFLVGSLWGDVVGSNMWGPSSYGGSSYESYADYLTARDAFRDTTLVISNHVYSIAWAILLIAAAIWSARTNRRGIFNAAMTFAAIHAYTQAFDTFYDEPLAYVIGGLAAIPLAWGLWQLNDRFENQNAPMA